MIRAVMAPPSPPWDSVLIGTRRLPNCDCTTNTASTKLAASDAGSHHRWKRGARSRRAAARKIGRASCRERVESSGGGGSVKKKKEKNRGGEEECIARVSEVRGIYA